MTYWQNKRALILGGSSGLGRALAEGLVDRGARVAIAARRQAALDSAVADLQSRPRTSVEGRSEAEVLAFQADVTSAADVERLTIKVNEQWHGLDFVVHCAGRSMRNDAITTPPDKYHELWELNFLSAVRIVQAFAPALLLSRGHVVLVSSLAGKCAPRYLGAYPASKFPLTAFAQQLRMELGPRGVHTLLVCPGPIAREGTTPRYADQIAGLPKFAAQPGGGARLKAIDPAQLAKRILSACESRRPELVVPAKAKLLFALAELWPAFGDWILQKETTGD